MNPKRVTPKSREHWLAMHLTYLGASRIAAAGGLDPYTTPLDLHLEMKGLKKVGMTPLMERGLLAEPMIDGYWQRDFPGLPVTNPHFVMVDDEHRIMCTPDRLAKDPDTGGIVNVQYKLVAKPEFEKWELNDKGLPVAPANYQLQVAQENMLLGAEYGIIAALVIGNYTAELWTDTVPRHAGAEAKILEIAAAFWQRIDTDTLPAIDYDRDGYAVKQVFAPNPALPPVDLTGDNRLVELAEKYRSVTHDIGLAEADKEAIKAEILAKLNGATSAVCGGWKITNRLTTRKEHVVPATTYPRLLVSPLKEGLAG